MKRHTNFQYSDSSVRIPNRYRTDFEPIPNLKCVFYNKMTIFVVVFLKIDLEPKTESLIDRYRIEYRPISVPIAILHSQIYARN